MGTVKVVLNREGVREMMRSPEMVDILAEEAEYICFLLGDGYDYDTYVGPNRANAGIWADSIRARVDNMKNNTLLKAIGRSS